MATALAEQWLLFDFYACSLGPRWSWQEHLAKCGLHSADCGPQDEWRENLSLHLQEELQAAHGMALQLRSAACHSLETLNHGCCLFL